MPKNAAILLAEDEQTDAYFVEWAFKRASLNYRICHVCDGQEAIEYLSGQGVYADRALYPVPSLVLVDLKMPRLDGFEVVDWVRHRPEWNLVPLIVLSSSHYPEDIERARALGADDYHIKPSNPQHLVQLALDLDARWLQGKREANHS